MIALGLVFLHPKEIFYGVWKLSGIALVFAQRCSVISPEYSAYLSTNQMQN